MTDMTMNRNILDGETLKSVTGGSWYNTESNIRAAGIDLLNEDGTPGEFGYIWNSGDYYFKGQKLAQYEVDILVYFAKKKGRPAYNYDEARYFFYDN